MLIYSDNETTEMKKVALSSVNFLSQQLNEFLAIYEKNILIQDDETRNSLEYLKFIAEMLNLGRYNELIVDPYYVIDFTDDRDNCLPGYYPIWCIGPYIGPNMYFFYGTGFSMLPSYYFKSSYIYYYSE